MTDNSANREYKNSVFTKLCEDKKRLIEIYNAVSGKNYPLDTDIEIATLEDVLFLDRRNDVAFVVEGRLIVLIEHQSTPCENMPIRILIYIARVFEKLFNADPKLKQAIYKTKLMNIPKPEFYVLYNGKDAFPESKELKLSDAFLTADAPDWLGGFLELIVIVYNINEGHNRDILRKSETLFGYAAFTAQVRRHVENGYELEKAIEQAVKDCVEKDILAEFLQVHASEVLNMLTMEFKMEEAVKVWKEEGIEEGMEKGKIEVARSMLSDGFPAETIRRYTGLDESSILSLR
jgi:predicted transposase/invertase (TIGR01784 family)